MSTIPVPKHTLKRELGSMGVRGSGPTVIVIGGMHGNEPAGILAMQKLLSEITPKEQELKGSLHCLGGNLGALAQQKRFTEEDLNRIWTQQRMERLKASEDIPSPEEKELRELKNMIDTLLDNKGPVYLIDLHTTSGPTQPFMIIDDTLVNRRFARHFPLPLVLGLDEYLPGTLLSYYRSRGLITIGMEGGQHDDPRAVAHGISFLRLVLHHTGSMRLNKEALASHRGVLRKATERPPGIYDIWHRESIAPEAEFELSEGFTSFQMLETGTHLGLKDNMPMILPRRSRIFMPRYQEQGADGFFLMRRIPAFLLPLSEVCRAWKLGKLLARLPGMKKVPGNPAAFTVNDRLFRISGEGLWHFLGYRVYRMSDDNWKLESRDSIPIDQSYREAPWYKKRRPLASLFS